MKVLLVLVLCIGTAFSTSSVCDECQGTVQRFQDAARNPAKLAVMKKLMGQFCGGMSKYAEECRIIANRIDSIVGYMGTPQSFCNTLNMCSSSHSNDGMNRVGLLFVRKFLNMIDGSKDNVCDECQLASSEILKNVDGQTQAQLHSFLSSKLCTHLKEYQSTCDALVDDLIPTLFKELNAMLSNSKQFCVDLKLCSAHQVNLHRMTANEVKNKLMGPKYVHNLLKSFQSIKMPEPHQMDSTSCMQCQMEMDLTLDMLKTSNGTAFISTLLNGVLCGMVLPPEFGCNDFVEIYGTTVVYMTLMQLDSESLCEGMNMCPNDTQSGSYQKNKAALVQHKCSNCETLANFLTQEMTKPKAKTEIVYGLQHEACQNMPHSLHSLCENFVGGLLPDVYDKFLHHLQQKTVCKAIQAC